MSTLNIEVIWNGILKLYETVKKNNIYIYRHIQCMLNIDYEIFNGILKGVWDGILKVNDMVNCMYRHWERYFQNMLKVCWRYITGVFRM